MLINLLQPYLSQKNTKLSANSFAQVSFKSLKTPIKAGNTLTRDVFESSKKSLREMLLDARATYIKNNPEAFLTLDHIKSNFDNWYVLNSVKGQTKDLQAVSTEDFCELSKIMKGIRLPEDITVYRAMSSNDFNIGEMKPEEFFSEYYQDGKKVVIPIYMSTSFDKNIAFRFAKNAPNRFIIKLNVPKNHPAVYMEELTPNDVYDKEDEVNVIKNSEIVLKNLKKVENPLNKEIIYEVEGDVVGFKDVEPMPKEEFVMDDEMLELFNAFKK